MSDQMSRRDWYICAAMSSGRSDHFAIIEADAALAAAGEQDGDYQTLHRRCHLAEAEIARLKAAAEGIVDDLKAQVSRLKRLQEPLTEEELSAAGSIYDDMPGVETMQEVVRQWEDAIAAVKARRSE